MKRILKKRYIFQAGMLALCAAALMALSGCATADAISQSKDFNQIMAAVKTDLFGSEEQECQWLSLSLPVHAGFEPIEDKSAYHSLTDMTMKSVYEDIEENLYQISSERDESSGYYVMKYTRLPSELAFDDIYIVKQAILCDHPEAFWVLGSYEVRNNFHDGNYLVLYSKYSYDEINAAFDEINAVTENILRQIPDDADELQREIIIHNAVVDSVSYDLEAAESDDPTADACHIYGALVKQKAICTGYAYSMKLLLNRVGIECRVVMGTSRNSGHMWNEVKINGEWYHLDATWDDSAVESDALYSRYKYFNLTDELVQVNHKISKNYSEMEYEHNDQGGYTTVEFYNFDLEECTSMQANYYNLYAAHVSEMNSDAVSDITDKIVDASKTREELVYILFDSSISNDEADTWLAKRTATSYSALEKGVMDANKYGIGTKIKNCSLVRISSKEEEIWSNLYIVRLVYV